jgi:hypothetical protein
MTDCVHSMLRSLGAALALPSKPHRLSAVTTARWFRTKTTQEPRRNAPQPTVSAREAVVFAGSTIADGAATTSDSGR